LFLKKRKQKITGWWGGWDDLVEAAREISFSARANSAAERSGKLRSSVQIEQIDIDRFARRARVARHFCRGDAFPVIAPPWSSAHYRTTLRFELFVSRRAGVQ
jgi:hypothetical protein